MSDQTVEGRKAFVQSLREVADFYESTEFPLPSFLRDFTGYASGPEEAAVVVKALGTFTKTKRDLGIALTRKFGDLLAVEGFVYHAGICTKVKKTKTIEVEEWECPKSLLGLQEVLNKDAVKDAIEKEVA